MRCCFFQKSFLFKDYFLTAAINLTTRGPSYTCLVFMCLLMLTQRVRLYLPILPHNFVNLLAKSGKLWTVQQLVRKQKFVLVWKKNVSQFFPLNVGALHVDLCIQTVYVKINFGLLCFWAADFEPHIWIKSLTSFLFLVGISWWTAPVIKVKVIQKSKLIRSKS